MIWLADGDQQFGAGRRHGSMADKMAAGVGPRIDPWPAGVARGADDARPAWAALHRRQRQRVDPRSSPRQPGRVAGRLPLAAEQGEHGDAVRCGGGGGGGGGVPAVATRLGNPVGDGVAHDLCDDVADDVADNPHPAQVAGGVAASAEAARPTAAPAPLSAPHPGELRRAAHAAALQEASCPAAAAAAGQSSPAAGGRRPTAGGRPSIIEGRRPVGGGSRPTGGGRRPTARLRPRRRVWGGECRPCWRRDGECDIGGGGSSRHTPSSPAAPPRHAAPLPVRPLHPAPTARRGRGEVGGGRGEVGGGRAAARRAADGRTAARVRGETAAPPGGLAAHEAGAQPQSGLSGGGGAAAADADAGSRRPRRG